MECARVHECSILTINSRSYFLNLPYLISCFRQLFPIFSSICHSLTVLLPFYYNFQILSYLLLGTLWMYVPVHSCARFCGSRELLSQGKVHLENCPVLPAPFLKRYLLFVSPQTKTTNISLPKPLASFLRIFLF